MFLLNQRNVLIVALKHGSNRLRCKACGKQTNTKDTVLYRIQNKDKCVDIVFLMLSEKKVLCLNDIRERILMTLKTAHAWRHMFLTSMVKIYNKLNPLIITSSQVEIDEIYLKFRVNGNRINIIKQLKDIKYSRRDEKTLNKHQDKIRSRTLTLSKSGKFYFSILIDTEINKVLKELINDIIGLDIGIKDFRL